MIEIWRFMLSKVSKVGTIDSSKIFDALNHNFHLCKLKAYGFKTNTVTFIRSYFSNKHQRRNVGGNFSKWQKISTGVSQNSILGSLLFNNFFNDLFFFIKTATLCNCADDNTMYSSSRKDSDMNL